MAALLLLASSDALAQEPDVRDIPPFVMMVVDSSGSMESLPACECNSSTDCTNCAPDCELPNTFDVPPKSPDGKELKKNRWAVTLEALTGRFKNFECNALDRTAENGATYDLGSSIPYYQPWECTSGDDCPYPGPDIQYHDGILDSYSDSLVFGLMTFDGEYTFKGSDDLFTETEYNANLASIEGMPGMWSYGGKQRFKYPGCADDYYVDSGARGPTATEGGLVSLDSCTTPPCDPYVLNKTIQESLLATRPYGGTPIAASLTDLYKHLTDVKDDYKECRKRYAILITDGEPDADFRQYLCHCEEPGNDLAPPCPSGMTAEDKAQLACPYQESHVIAKKLVEGSGSEPKVLDKLFVLGMSVKSPAAVEILNKIAEQGGTEEALAADSPEVLRSTLDGVFSPLIAPISRSVPGFATGLSGIQYQISAGFKITASSLSGTAPPWTGLIERRRFLCSPSGEPEPDEIRTADRFELSINTQEEKYRKLYTALPSKTGFTADDMDEPMRLGDGELCTEDGCRVLEIEHTDVKEGIYGPSVTADQRTEIINWMYGDPSTARKDRKLGDIYHSSPTIVGPPIDEPADDAYTRFKDIDVVKERPLVMYIASNDGILHAISVEDYPVDGFPLTKNKDHERLAIKAGEEFWGFIPPLLMGKLKDQLPSHQFNLDATPVVKDVYFQRGGPEEETEYRTVLIMGMRKGGSGYFALDVTDPVTGPKFLWQFTDKHMGLTYGQPEIVQATFNWDPEDIGATNVQTRAVAILPGGVGEVSSTTSGSPGCLFGLVTKAKQQSGEPFFSYQVYDDINKEKAGHRPDVRCWKPQGRAFYFVDVETGKLIKKVYDDDDNEGTGIFFPSPIVGTPTAYQDAVATIADRGYVMDADGVLWRIDMSSTNVEKNDPTKGWTLRPFHDVFWDKRGPKEQGPWGGETTYEKPILSLDDERRVVVIVGTGDTDNFEKPLADNRVVSLTEFVPAGDPTKPEDYQALINWELRNRGDTDNDKGLGFYPSELVTGSMALFDGQLFMASFISNATEDACETGRGRLWSLDYRASDPADPNKDNSTFGVLEKPLTKGPLRIEVPVEEGVDSDGNLFNIDKDKAEPNLLVQGLGTTQLHSCFPEDADPLKSYFAPQLANIEQRNPPAFWVVAQASKGQQREGSRLGSVQAKINRKHSFSRVTSWASSVD